MECFVEAPSELQVGMRHQLVWWLKRPPKGMLNDLTITAVRLRPRSHGRDADPDIELGECDRGRLRWEPADGRETYLKAMTGFKVLAAGEYGVDLTLDLTLDGGQRIEFRSAHPLQFSRLGQGKEGRMQIKVGGSAVVMGVPRDAVIDVAGSAVIDGGASAPGAVAAPLPLRTDREPDRYKVYPIDLYEPDYEGVSPPDFQVFAKVWHERGRKAVDLAFIDPANGTALASARVGDPCCLRLLAFQEGHVLLLGRGTSNDIFVYAPNTAAAASAELSKGKALVERFEATFPGSLLPLPLPADPDTEELQFGDKGIEQALAIVFDKWDEPPLPAAPTVLDKLPDATVATLLRKAQASRFSALGMAQIRVE
ncbi:MAG: hypothetical protein ACK5XM_14575 [Betaproteobacteria bacterium]